MISVLIIDDEKWICELINKSIEWTELGMQVAGMSENGIEAMKILKSRPIDVAITDIRMPGMDGISMIRNAREQGIETRFIIISGYQDFEYAQNAIKYNVRDYLLKPIDEDELTITLYKIKEEIRKSRETRERSQALETKLEESSGKLKEQFIRMIVKNGTVAPAFENMDPKTEFSFTADSYLCVIFRTDSMSGVLCEKDVAEILNNKVADTVNKCMREHCRSIFNFMDDNSITYIFNFDKREDIKKNLKDCFIELRLKVSTFRNYVLTMGVGSIVDDFGRIRHSYADADIAVKYRLIAGYNKMIESEGLKLDKSAANDILTPVQKRRLVNLILAANTNELGDWIDAIFRFHDKQKINPAVLFDLAKSIFFCLAQTLSETGYNIAKKNMDLFFFEIESSLSLEMFVRKIKDRVMKEIESWVAEKKEESCRPVELIKVYIHENYENDISLVTAAEKVYLNPNYLSALFKKETDMTFLEYLQKCRVEAALDLLKEPGIRISKIPGMVGYKDTKHFAKLFRKIVGLTPSKYRKLYT